MNPAEHSVLIYLMDAMRAAPSQHKRLLRIAYDRPNASPEYLAALAILANPDRPLNERFDLVYELLR